MTLRWRPFWDLVMFGLTGTLMLKTELTPVDLAILLTVLLSAALAELEVRF